MTKLCICGHKEDEHSAFGFCKHSMSLIVKREVLSKVSYEKTIQRCPCEEYKEKKQES